MTIVDIPEIRHLLSEIARRNYSSAQLREIVRGWRRDVELIRRKRRKV